ncbi:hypothetical protein KQ41_06175 [Lysinibacillus fusiformis]|uniref:hypothetical protein n=1 Tax=Lysinibacillus fusiformis TaxID=28031 RepID=UPI000504BDB0|nr:hypothetical protein [Lysinibacillus fusiformis]KGA83633.1 hypothetical protein KQ41_06175 [Lysinibacillus fusiformis]
MKNEYVGIKEIAEIGASIEFEKDGQILDLAVDEVFEDHVVVTGGINVQHKDYTITAYDLQERKMRELPRVNLLFTEQEVGKEMMEKFIITQKDNDFAEIGHCFRCKFDGEKVTIPNDMSWWSVTIPLEQFRNEFKEMSKEDYSTYINACNEGEDQVIESVIKKYLG